MNRQWQPKTITVWATATLLIVSLTLLARETRADQVITESLSVQGSECVGVDCINGETYGQDTLRLKENNLRIKFDDTTSAGLFPRNDWQITINDDTEGGLSRFSIDDITNSTTPLTIEFQAPSHSLYVNRYGRVGLGTNTPAMELHVVDGDTPTLRLDQDTSGGYDPQTWDVGGNEANFFIRDITNASNLVFRIKPGAPKNSIYVAQNGDLGLGTDSPDNSLEIQRGSGPVTIGMQYSGNTNDAFEIVADATGMKIQSRADPNKSIQLAANGTVQFGNTGRFVWNPDTRVASVDGSLSVAGGWYATSSRASKHAIRRVDTGAVLDKLVALPVAEWSYIEPETDVRHLGPMAEDFRAAFQLGKDARHINLLDAVGVTIAAVQGMYTRLEQQNAELKKKNAELEARLAAIEAAIGTGPAARPAPARCAAALTSQARTDAGAF